MGQWEEIGRPPKIGWEKKWSRKGYPIRRHGSDFIYTKNSARPRSDFLYTKNVPPPSGNSEETTPVEVHPHVFLFPFSHFSQKLISWVFNDQPCECADVGQSRTIGRAAKIGWEKKWSRKWYPRFLSVKSLIGRFYWEETGDRRVIADPAARIRFYLHKEFRAAEIWFSLHKECPAAESWFSLHTLFRGLCEIL